MLKVWMSHGDKVTELPPGFKLMASHAELPDRRHGRRGAWLLRRAVPPRGHAHGHRARDARALRAAASPARPDWVMRDHIDEAVAGIRAAGGRRGSHPRPVGRCRFQRGRGADPPRDRRPAHLRLRRPRPAAPERGQDGDGHVRRPSAREGRACGRERAVPRPPEGRDRSRGQAQDHRPRVRRGVPARGRAPKSEAPPSAVRSGWPRARSTPT